MLPDQRPQGCESRHIQMQPPLLTGHAPQKQPHQHPQGKQPIGRPGGHQMPIPQPPQQIIPQPKDRSQQEKPPGLHPLCLDGKCHRYRNSLPQNPAPEPVSS
jgi:hypothetical protein